MFPENWRNIMLALSSAQSSIQVVYASDGRPISVTSWQTDKSEPIGNILILHGMAEHHRRYAPFAMHLAKLNFKIFSYDHRGHGHDENLGFFADHDGWKKVIDDVLCVVKEISAKSEKPIFLFGHSMGSFIAQRSLFEPNLARLKGVILSGSTMQNPHFLKIAKLIAWLECKRQGKKARSDLINFLSFGSFNKAFKPNRTDFDWLSRDEKQVDAYIADPLCGFHCTNQLWYDFLEGLIETYTHQNRTKINKNLPFYLLGGSDDPVGKNNGLTRLGQNLKSLGITDITCVIYPHARHEMLNETNREKVFNEISAWLLRYVS